MRKKGFLQLFLLALPVAAVFPQQIVRPNQVLKSHETLIIHRIEMDHNAYGSTLTPFSVAIFANGS